MIHIEITFNNMKFTKKESARGTTSPLILKLSIRQNTINK